MKSRRLYLDTSVIGGCFDSEFEDATRLLWQQARKGHWQFFTSIVAEREIQNALDNVRQIFSETFDSSNTLDTSPEVEQLAEAYIAARIVTPKYIDDALHVAMASVHGILLIVSWNFRHLVNIHREDAFNAVNLLHGWPPVRIVNPKELVYAEDH